MRFHCNDNHINYYHDQTGHILLSYISNTHGRTHARTHAHTHTHSVVIITHYKCMGYVIIPKPNFSSLLSPF